MKSEIFQNLNFIIFWILLNFIWDILYIKFELLFFSLPEATSKRLQYLQEIKEELAKYKEESKSGHGRWSIDEKRALMEAFSHGKDIR
jgi:membrane protein insertase Oxa1/YidC/SpoIIIJ